MGGVHPPRRLFLLDYRPKPDYDATRNMQPFFAKTATARVFLLALILPAGDLIKGKLALETAENYSLSTILSSRQSTAQPSVRLSIQRLESLLSKRLSPFPRSQISRFAKHILALCEYHRFDPVLILSLIDVESRFRVKASSEAGAQGLMQLMPETARFIIGELDFHLSGLEKWSLEKIENDLENDKLIVDPFINTALGISYLAWLRDHYDGSPFHLLAAYNVGPARMDALLSRKHFTPVKTQEYFNAIHKRVPRFRKALHRSLSPIECLVDLRKKGCYQAI